MHTTIHAGYRFISNARKSFIDPGAMLIHGFGNGTHIMTNVRYELLHAFWVAGGICTTGEVFGQAGVILDKYSFAGSIIREGALRFGVKLSANTGALSYLASNGLEFYLGYIFKVD
jgi:hypothetical protein